MPDVEKGNSFGVLGFFPSSAKELGEAPSETSEKTKYFFTQLVCTTHHHEMMAATFYSFNEKSWLLTKMAEWDFHGQNLKTIMIKFFI